MQTSHREHQDTGTRMAFLVICMEQVLLAFMLAYLYSLCSGRGDQFSGLHTNEQAKLRNIKT